MSISSYVPTGWYRHYGTSIRFSAGQSKHHLSAVAGDADQGTATGTPRVGVSLRVELLSGRTRGDLSVQSMFRSDVRHQAGPEFSVVLCHGARFHGTPESTAVASRVAVRTGPLRAEIPGRYLKAIFRRSDRRRRQTDLSEPLRRS